MNDGNQRTFTCRLALSALQPRVLDDVVELGQHSRRKPLGLVEIRGPERPREVLPFSDDRDEELRHRLPDTPVAAPQ